MSGLEREEDDKNITCMKVQIENILSRLIYNG